MSRTGGAGRSSSVSGSSTRFVNSVSLMEPIRDRRYVSSQGWNGYWGPRSNNTDGKCAGPRLIPSALKRRLTSHRTSTLLDFFASCCTSRGTSRGFTFAPDSPRDTSSSAQRDKMGLKTSDCKTRLSCWSLSNARNKVLRNKSRCLRRRNSDHAAAPAMAAKPARVAAKSRCHHAPDKTRR
eukprot:CAMPEP_0117497202 /NCGR_PEP_ID=MMETSP0784-20121206/21058_1 /TAXON_ID=39447 /ORGANISM="" /LENGTH=180 /DNA_ID=CAMNT_0005292211 /DNA_START=47 /DNA_END=589 /DNA_ORIENTATION=+